MTQHVKASPMMAPAMAATIENNVRKVLDQHGIGAFAMPRAAALVHAAGHGIVACAQGWLVRFVRVWAETVPLPGGSDVVAWTGLCQTASGAWTADNHSKVANDLKHAIDMTAGLVAETLTKVNLPGSSLDEVVRSQSLAALIVDKLRPGLNPMQLNVTAKAFWNELIWGAAVDILQANRGPLKALAAALDEFGEVRGRRLRTILATVKRSERGLACADRAKSQ